MKTRNRRKYSWIPDLPDKRDFVYAPGFQAAHLPPVVDLRPQCPPIYDQGPIGSCTGNSGEAMNRFIHRKLTGIDFEGSRLFVYYNGRVAEGDPDDDSGAMLRDVIKAMVKVGVCPEALWPYDVQKVTTLPPQRCYQEALKHQAVKYNRIRNSLHDMKACLARGNLFVFGFSVYESFESDEVARTGNVPLPGNDEQLLGGHAVVAVGYRDDHRQFIVRNSWGREFGDRGYCYFPYDYLLNQDLSDDFWTIGTVES